MDRVSTEVFTANYLTTDAESPRCQTDTPRLSPE